ncbi:hypothetical protein XCR1_860002 [Xenorhabdus cabanillasii JM26]|uniref:Uncharacterized protein n=1 Tax=Xenorhabdus cabanillasii JM26 TaxID=1427517 RepID=W1JB23_9GAMM|nr:hypothetical protein Xcab_02880 [Xenorhabdus cabanillasii JM26]CDL87218.1 hypothetical protein XCR1_860002 [Xenorhabdus cabanillasii JM26]
MYLYCSMLEYLCGYLDGYRKEFADIILLDKNQMALEEGVKR